MAADKMKASLVFVGLVLLLVNLVYVRDVVCEDEDFEDEGAAGAESVTPEEAPKAPRERVGAYLELPYLFGIRDVNIIVSPNW